MHNVLGFSMTWVAIFLALTGLVFGFQWFARSVYWIASGGETMVEHTNPLSDTTKPASKPDMADFLWSKHLTGVNPGESIGVYFASSPSDPVEVVINYKPGTCYKSDYLHYDQFSGNYCTPKTHTTAGTGMPNRRIKSSG